MKTQILYVAVEVTLQESMGSGNGSVPTSEAIRDVLQSELDTGTIDVDGWVYDLEVLAVSSTSRETHDSALAVKAARRVHGRKS